MTSPILATIDFEASSLAMQGAPIEVGIALWQRGGAIQSWSSLIRFEATALWSVESAEVHGIKLEEVLDAPRAVAVAERLNAHMIGSPFAFCDGSENDEKWLEQLFGKTELDPIFRLVPIEAMPGLHMGSIARRMWNYLETARTPHRAADDAVRLMRAYAHALGEAPSVVPLE